MVRSQPSWIRHIRGSRYKLVSILAALLIIGPALLLIRCTSVATQFEEQSQSSAKEKLSAVLFQDEFTDPDSGWPTESRDDASFGYQSPSFYFLEVGVPDASLVVFRELDFDNFTAEVKVLVNFTNATGDFHYGLAIRRSGEQYYAFLISPRTETWRVLKRSSAGAVVLGEARHNSISDLYKVYTLSVEANGSTFSYQINDQPVIEFTDSDYANGEVGFIVETFDEPRVRVIYDSLLVQEIEGEAAVVVPSATLAPSSPDRPSPVSGATVASFSPTSSSTSTATPTPLTLLPTLLPTATRTDPTSTPSLTPTATSALPTPTATATSRPSPLPTTTSVPTTVTPGLVPTDLATSTPTPSLPTGAFELLNPLAPHELTYGPTDFEWEWSGAVPAGYGFEVRVWREGEPLAGAHDAIRDNENKRIVSLGENKYRLSLDIKGAAGVRGRSGEYLWTVALVQISPDYVDLGQQAAPARLRFEAGGGGDSDGGGDAGGGGGGGGVGID